MKDGDSGKQRGLPGNQLSELDDAYQITIFAPRGYAQSLRLVEKDDWKGHALCASEPHLTGTHSSHRR